MAKAQLLDADHAGRPTYRRTPQIMFWRDCVTDVERLGPPLHSLARDGRGTQYVAHPHKGLKAQILY